MKRRQSDIGRYSSSRKVSNKRLKKDKPRNFGKFFLRLGIFSALLALLGATAYLSWNWLCQSEMFRISSVTVSGDSRIEKSEILSLAALDFSENLLLMDMESLEIKIESHPWIKKAELGRNFPDKLVIKIMEREPVAFVNSEKFYLVDTEGVIFKEYEPKEALSLPIISGLKLKADTNNNVWRVEESQKKGLVSSLYIIKLASKGMRTLGLSNISQIDVIDNGIVLYTADRSVPFHFSNENAENMKKQFSRAEKILYHLYSSGKYASVDKVNIDFMNDLALAHLKGN